MGSAGLWGSAVSGGEHELAGVSVLLVTSDLEARERLTRALRTRGVEVAERRHGPPPAVDVVLVDTDAEAGMRKEIELVTSDVRMRWSSLVRYPFLKAVPAGLAPDVSGIEEAIAPALSADRTLRERLVSESSLRLQLAPLGPVRILRAAAAAGSTMQVTFEHQGSTIRCEVADGLLVCAFNDAPDGRREGGAALGPLWDMELAQVRIEAREHPSAVNIMEPVDQALEVAALERQSKLEGPANDTGSRRGIFDSVPSPDDETTDPNVGGGTGSDKPTDPPARRSAPSGAIEVGAPRFAVGDASKKFANTMTGGSLFGSSNPPGATPQKESTSRTMGAVPRVKVDPHSRRTVAGVPRVKSDRVSHATPAVEEPKLDPKPAGLPKKAPLGKGGTLYGMGAPSQSELSEAAQRARSAAPKLGTRAPESPEDTRPKASVPGLPKLGAALSNASLPPIDPSLDFALPKRAPVIETAPAVDKQHVPAAFASTQLHMPRVSSKPPAGLGSRTPAMTVKDAPALDLDLDTESAPPVFYDDDEPTVARPSQAAPASSARPASAVAEVPSVEPATPANAFGSEETAAQTNVLASAVASADTAPPPSAFDDGLPPAIEDDGLPPAIEDDGLPPAIDEEGLPMASLDVDGEDDGLPPAIEDDDDDSPTIEARGLVPAAVAAAIMGEDRELHERPTLAYESADSEPPEDIDFESLPPELLLDDESVASLNPSELGVGEAQAEPPPAPPSVGLGQAEPSEPPLDDPTDATSVVPDEESAEASSDESFDEPTEEEPAPIAAPVPVESAPAGNARGGLGKKLAVVGGLVTAAAAAAFLYVQTQAPTGAASELTMAEAEMTPEAPVAAAAAELAAPSEPAKAEPEPEPEPEPEVAQKPEERVEEPAPEPEAVAAEPEPPPAPPAPAASKAASVDEDRPAPAEGERDKRGSDELCADGQDAERAGKLDEALRLYERGLEFDPRSPRAYAGMARVHLARGDTTKAVDAARHAVKLRRRRASYRGLLGDALEAAGEHDEAKDEYRKANELKRRR